MRTSTMFQNSQRPAKAWLRCFAASLLTCAVAVLAGAAGSAHAANLIANGDFMANASAFTVAPGYLNAQSSGNPASITGWTDNAGVGVVGINGTGTGLAAKDPFGPTAPGGRTYAFCLWNTVSLGQPLTSLTPNTQYQLDFDVAARAGQVASYRVAIYSDGTHTTAYCDTGVVAGNNAAFVHVTATFTTPTTLGAAPNIQLVNEGGGDGNVAVCFANVSLQLLVVSPEMLYKAAVMNTPGLISYYSFNTLTANDDFGANNGTMGGTAGYASGRSVAPDSALNLDGGGWDNLGAVPAFDFTSGDGTVELWLKAGWITGTIGTLPPIIVSDFDSASSAEYVMWMSPAKTTIYLWQQTLQPAFTLPANAGTNWHHLAVVFHAGNATVIWDGQNLGTQAFTMPLISGNKVQLGCLFPGGDGAGFFQRWQGKLDAVAFFNTNLSLSTIQAHFNAAYDPSYVTFPVSAYGAVVNSGGDSGPAIRQAIQAAMSYGPGAIVSFQPGTYNISPDGATGYGLNMAYANGLSLRGSNTTLTVTEPLTGGIFWQFCQNCTVSGITIDYNPLPFTQGTIVAKGASTFDVTIDAGYPQLSEARFANPALANWGMVMDPVKPRQQKAGADNFVPMNSKVLVSGSTHRFTPANSGVISQVAVNDRFVYVARNGGYDLFFANCTNCMVTNVTVNTGPSAALVVTTAGYGMQVRNFAVAFPTNSTRLLTTDADGIMFQNLRGGPIVADSYLEGMADDGMSIGSIPNPVYLVTSTTSIKAGTYTPIKSGDRVQVFNPVTGTLRGEATVTTATLSGTNYLLTLAAPITGMVAGSSLANADSLFNLNAGGEGYLFTNNVINAHRGRGILPYTGNGMVVSNRITGSSMGGIEMMNYSGPYWWIGPLAANVVIRGNTINGCGYADAGGYAGIRMNAYKAGINIPAAGICLRNITLENNTITNWPQIGIHALSVTNLKVINNQIQSSAAANSYAGNIQGMVFGNSSAIMINGGSHTDPRANLHAGIRLLSTVAKGTPGFSTNNLTFNLVTGVTKILDDRTAGPANATPSIAPIPTQTIMPGSNLVLTVTATDATVTPLYFSLVSGPAGAAFDDPLQLAGIFTWRPTVAQAGTNQVVVAVQDNGSPNLIATQTFQIVVTLPAQPAISSANYVGNQFSMSIAGPAGLDYIVQTSTNISSPTSWVGVWTNYAAVPPLMFTDTLIPGANQKYYRVLLGP